MNNKEKNISKFLTKISTSFSENGFKTKEIEISEKDLINSKECFYIFDLEKNKIIYHKGFQNLLGFYEKDLNLEFILEKYHPEDIETVIRIAKATILHCLSTPYQSHDNALQMTYRIRKNDNSYIKVLGQSTPYHINAQGLMTHILIKLTDLSFLESTFCVNWYFHAKDLDVKAFRNQIYKAYNNFFTKREKEIIIKIKNEQTNPQIAEKLNISEHTVATHRKHILKKANCHNVKDLLLFCKRKGII